MSDELKRCELEETESYPSENGWVHVLECSECGRTCEHVNGTYPHCPYCSAVNVLDENYESKAIPHDELELIRMAEKYKIAPDDEVDSREKLEADIAKRAVFWSYDDYVDDEQVAHLREKFMAEAVGWLDRQDEITRQELQASNTWALQERYKALNRVAELKGELEAQRKRANDAERGVLSEEWYASRDRYEDDVAELKAERDKMEAEYEEREESIVGAWQDAMTKREEQLDTMRDVAREFRAERDKLNTRCNALETERDDLLRITKELEERNGGLLEGRAHWIDQAVSIYRHFYPHNAYAVPDDVSSMVLAKIAELEAELARKQRACDVQRDSFLKLEAENADLRKELGK